MRIAFSDLPEEVVSCPFGGKKELLKRAWSDGSTKIMYDRLPVGAALGVHTHETNCEVIYLLSGIARFTIDGGTEIVRAGEAHYCPRGHSHGMENIGESEVVFLAVVAQQ